MGIAASKVVCYTAFGGIDPAAALPVCIDAGAELRRTHLFARCLSTDRYSTPRFAPAGTDNEMLLNDPFYIGLRHKCVCHSTQTISTRCASLLLTPARVQARARRAVR